MVSVSRTATVPGSTRKRWYVWYGQGKDLRKEGLRSYVKRLQALGHHGQAAEVIVMAVKKGYRV